MKQATKKELGRHTKGFDSELGHSEGKFWCDCLTRGYRHYLAAKLYGFEDIKQEVNDYYWSQDKDVN